MFKDLKETISKELKEYDNKVSWNREYQQRKDNKEPNGNSKMEKNNNQNKNSLERLNSRFELIEESPNLRLNQQREWDLKNRKEKK